MKLQGLEPLCCGSLVNQNKSLVRRPLGAVKLAGNVIDRHPLWRSSLVEPGAKVTVIVFTEETWWSSSNTLSECYNNVDVGVPLWLTEPRDKHPRQEFAFSYPSL